MITCWSDFYLSSCWGLLWLNEGQENRRNTILYSVSLYCNTIRCIYLYLVDISALPRSPSNVRVSDVQPTSVRLSWSYDGDVTSEVQYYVIQYKPKAATWDYKEISGAITNFYDIRGLRWVTLLCWLLSVFWKIFSILKARRAFVKAASSKDLNKSQTRPGEHSTKITD